MHLITLEIIMKILNLFAKQYNLILEIFSHLNLLVLIIVVMLKF